MESRVDRVEFTDALAVSSVHLPRRNCFSTYSSRNGLLKYPAARGNPSQCIVSILYAATMPGL